MFTTANFVISVLDTQLLWGWCHERIFFKDFYKSLFVCWRYSLKLITHVFTLYIMRAITNISKLRQPVANPSPRHRKLENDTLWLNSLFNEIKRWNWTDESFWNESLRTMKAKITLHLWCICVDTTVQTSEHDSDEFGYRLCYNKLLLWFAGG